MGFSRKIAFFYHLFIVFGVVFFSFISNENGKVKPDQIQTLGQSDFETFDQSRQPSFTLINQSHKEDPEMAQAELK